MSFFNETKKVSPSLSPFGGRIMKEISELLSYFPNNVGNLIRNTINKNERILDELQEIRIRCDRPIILKLRNFEIVIEYKVNESEILSILERLCNNSIYAYKNQICEGFITVKGGHRVGITGTAVIDNGKIINIKYITSLDFRIAREVLGGSLKILDKILDVKNNEVNNTLIVSPPGKGKTTMLRDIIRNISNGIPNINFRGKTCGVVDERGEIAAMYHGVPQNDIGIRTDVIENVSKAKGMKMLIRSMAPEVIACDEVGSKEDIEAIKEATISGVKGIFTMHGKNLEEIKLNKDINELIENKQIERIIFI